MSSFDYHEPTSIAEATALLARYGTDAVAMAGGVDLTRKFKSGGRRPGHVIALRRLPGLADVRTDGDGLWLGPLATHAALERSPAVRAHHPALRAAFTSIATIRIRNQGTLGGNLASAEAASDPPPVLMIFDAIVQVARPDGTQRSIGLDAFFVGEHRSVLEPAELIVGIRVPPVAAGTRATYARFNPGSADDYPTVSVAAALRVDAEGRIAVARVAVGAIGDLPVRAHSVETALVGQLPTDATLTEAAALARNGIEAIADRRGSVSYKREMARVWTRRALTTAATPMAAA